MGEMVERVAEALWLKVWPIGPTWYSSPNKEQFRDYARAAIAAMPIEELRQRYKAVELWPEQDSQGWSKMLDLRTAVWNFLAALEPVDEEEKA